MTESVQLLLTHEAGEKNNKTQNQKNHPYWVT